MGRSLSSGGEHRHIELIPKYQSGFIDIKNTKLHIWRLWSTLKRWVEMFSVSLQNLWPEKFHLWPTSGRNNTGRVRLDQYKNLRSLYFHVHPYSSAAFISFVLFSANEERLWFVVPSQVHQRNGSRCTDAATRTEYTSLRSIQLYTNQRKRHHTSYCWKYARLRFHFMLTIIVFSPNKSHHLKNAHFLNEIKKTCKFSWMSFFVVFLLERSKHSCYAPHWTVYHLTFKAY